MKRSRLRLEEVAGWDNLLTAAWRAAAGKRRRHEVRRYLDRLPKKLAELQREILSGTVKCGFRRRFQIRDPKPRVITAPCFRERVLHHALMALAGPVLERALVADTFACVRGRGTRAAVLRCQHHARRFGWHAKLDVRQYFRSIDHQVLKRMLGDKFKDEGLLCLMFRIIDAYGEEPGRGLPIGALTSQCFANYYLSPLDRFLLEERRVQGTVRYMDDFILWAGSRAEIRDHVAAVEGFLREELLLRCRDDIVINRSRAGVTFCGYRVFPGTIRLSGSRRRRHARARARWERLWLEGRITALELQRGFDAALAITHGADAAGWLRSRERACGMREWRYDV